MDYVLRPTETEMDVLEFIIFFRNVCTNVIVRGKVFPVETFISMHASPERYRKYLEEYGVDTYFGQKMNSY